MTDQFSIRGVIKRTAFLRSDLTVRVDPPPPHHLRSAFYEYCFGVCLTLDYDFIPLFIFIGPMCTWGPIIGSPCHSPYKSFLKPCEALVKTVNVVNVVKI